MPAQEAIEFGNAAIEFVIGHVLAETGPSLAHAHPVEDDILVALQRAGPGRFRHLDRALAAVDPRQVTKDRIFDAGFYTMLRGLERRLEEFRGLVRIPDEDLDRQERGGQAAPVREVAKPVVTYPSRVQGCPDR
jgi:hypothetical protein